MTLPSSIETVEHGVRDGRVAPVTCAACGCRLAAETTDTGETRWYHYTTLGGRDARGCTVACVDKPHDRQGNALRAH